MKKYINEDLIKILVGENINTLLLFKYSILYKTISYYFININMKPIKIRFRFTNAVKNIIDITKSYIRKIDIIIFIAFFAFVNIA